MDEVEIRKLPRVYLDTNKWIELSRISKGKNFDAVSEEICSRLLELSSADKILIPFSSFNYREIVKGDNTQRRDKMIDFMLDVSKGWYFKPVNRYFEYEVKNWCYKKLGQEKRYDIFRDIVSNRGDGVLTGDVAKIVTRYGHNPTKEELIKIEEAQKTWDRHMTDPVWVKQMLKQEEPQKFAKIDAMLIGMTTKNLEFYRSADFGISDLMFDKCNRLRYTHELVVPHLQNFCFLNKNLSPKLFSTLQEFESMMEDMPALNIHIELSLIRDKESKKRPVKCNDYYDTLHYATGLPYANIMVGEKMFGSISKRRKLDKKYDCHLCIATEISN